MSGVCQNKFLKLKACWHARREPQCLCPSAEDFHREFSLNGRLRWMSAVQFLRTFRNSSSKRLQGKQTHAQINKTETYQYEIFALTLVSDSVPLSPSTHALSPSPLLFVCPSITGPHSDSRSHLPLAVEVTGSPRCSRLFVGCLTSQQHTSVSQGRICPDNFTCSFSHSIPTPGRPVPELTI